MRARGRAEPWALERLRHRGPDGEGQLVQPDFGLVLEHTRLAIIDPENREADQPFSDETGRWTIVYNGEIFNYRELKTALEKRGATFRTDSDTEVLLRSLILDGEAALGRLRGMFAFVLWDSETRELFAARDQIGVKPLYYTISDGVFIAASELRALLGHPSVRGDLDATAVVEYLSFGHVSGDRTLIEGIRKLPPGHALRVRDGELAVREYWDVVPPDPPRRTQRVDDELVAQLSEAVTASLVSDVPVSLMLSGGLDSATIAALAARHVNPEDLTAYSVAFGLENDESGVAGRLASDLGLNHRKILLTEATVVEEFEPWLERLDVPTANPTWLAVSAIARSVHADGIKVLLSGDGGDELFGGYDRWMIYLRFYRLLWRRTPRLVRKVGGRALRPFLTGLAGDIARRASEGADLFVGSRPFHDDDLARCLGPVGARAAAKSPPEEPVVRLRRRLDERFPNADYLSWMSYAALKTHLVEDYLVRLDTMGMQESVEGRVPLLDPQLVRWTFTIPEDVKVNGYEQKALFRRAIQPLLPEYISSRPKQGFCAPVATWANALMARRIGNAPALVERGLISEDAVDTLRRDRSSGAAFALWAVGTLDAWSERNL